jgi:hypothetical protein
LTAIALTEGKQAAQMTIPQYAVHDGALILHPYPAFPLLRYRHCADGQR